MARSAPARRLLAAALPLLVGGLLVTGCGGSGGEGQLSPEQASDLKAAAEDARDTFKVGECEEADEALASFDSQVESLDVDPEIVDGLEQLSERMNELSGDCDSEPTTTTTDETSTSSTTTDPIITDTTTTDPTTETTTTETTTDTTTTEPPSISTTPQPPVPGDDGDDDDGGGVGTPERKQGKGHSKPKKANGKAKGHSKPKGRGPSGSSGGVTP